MYPSGNIAFLHTCYAKIVVDFGVGWCYISSMNSGRKRKGRADRTHIIYALEINGKSYIGLTFLRDRSVKKSMHYRIKQHFYNATVRGYDWSLSEEIRRLDSVEDIGYKVLAKVRGKIDAHDVERQFIDELKPELNSDVRPQKK